MEQFVVVRKRRQPKLNQGLAVIRVSPETWEYLYDLSVAMSGCSIRAAADAAIGFAKERTVYIEEDVEVKKDGSKIRKSV